MPDSIIAYAEPTWSEDCGWYTYEPGWSEGVGTTTEAEREPETQPLSLAAEDVDLSLWLADLAVIDWPEYGKRKVEVVVYEPPAKKRKADEVEEDDEASSSGEKSKKKKKKGKKEEEKRAHILYNMRRF
ncbi:hypothetical protein LTR37_017945 [Vermiconidia calcicola]|uniref:Uncharacterized protein n=1 Tax=Vermiconidia calcicola TaxID=1690605 RepID=A0ACC3MIG3_9PEZI|nr:hypothetical protein LTR37_017945 [Vermiconidia calcicola]